MPSRATSTAFRAALRHRRALSGQSRPKSVAKQTGTVSTHVRRASARTRAPRAAEHGALATSQGHPESLGEQIRLRDPLWRITHQLTPDRQRLDQAVLGCEASREASVHLSGLLQKLPGGLSRCLALRARRARSGSRRQAQRPRYDVFRNPPRNSQRASIPFLENLVAAVFGEPLERRCECTSGASPRCLGPLPGRWTSHRVAIEKSLRRGRAASRPWSMRNRSTNSRSYCSSIRRSWSAAQ